MSNGGTNRYSMETTKTAPGALRILWSEGFFLNNKTSKNIEDKLAKWGYNFSKYTLGMALKSAKFLTRYGQKGKYSYRQKYPFVDEKGSEKTK